MVAGVAPLEVPARIMQVHERIPLIALVAVAVFAVVTSLVSGYVLLSRDSVRPDGEDAAFSTLPVGGAFPSGEDCARRVRSADLDREVRPENAEANRTTPEDLSLPPWPDFWAPPVNRSFVPRVDGNFTGSTDEIIAWGACKWGVDANVVRAMAVSETFWRQSFVGDEVDDPDLCVGDYDTPCPTSFGLLQLKHFTRPGSWPDSQESTAFNVDYSLAVLRGCFEGYVTYLENGYAPGDIWGCAGWHFSGEWLDDDALGYIERTREHYDERAWLTW